MYNTAWCSELVVWCVFSETWLHDKITDNSVAIDGFQMFRGDRPKESGKKVGGGVCIILYVKRKWYHPNNMSRKFTHCSPDLEIWTVNARPYYLPREFTHLLVVSVYIPPSANAEEAAELIASHVHDLDTRAPYAVKIVTGDFNHCDLGNVLPGYQQQVKCKIRGGSTLDLMYCNIMDACTSVPLAPLGRSDHNLVSLLPKYRPRVQREPPVTATVQLWSMDACETLKGCLECTDWSTFTFTAKNVSELADTVCGYIRPKFCVDSVVPKETVKIYPNNKPRGLSLLRVYKR